MGGLTPACPRCARPVATAQPRCIYCGASLAGIAGAARGAALPAAAAAEPEPRATPRALVILDLEGADARTLAAVLGLARSEAEQRLRRGGAEVHRILSTEAAEAEAARLRERALRVFTVPEEEVRRAHPIVFTRGGPEETALALAGEAGAVAIAADDVLLIVRGSITREYPPAPELRRVRTATLDPGYRVHVHRRSDPRPVELDPSAFDFGRDGAPAGAQIEIAGWLDRLFPSAPRDDSFRLVAPALGPAAAASGGGVAAAEALARRAGREPRLVLDNLAQFRFHSAWRAAVHRRRRA